MESDPLLLRRSHWIDGTCPWPFLSDLLKVVEDNEISTQVITTTLYSFHLNMMFRRSGMAPGTALGFFWALGGLSHFDKLFFLIEYDKVAAERKELYRFSTDIAKLALRIAERYGSPGEKW